MRLLVVGRAEDEEQNGGRTVKVTHEALIRNWERLRGWLNEDREFLWWRQRTKMQVDEWEQHERDSSYLLRGVSLSEAERWLVARPHDLATSEQQFVREGMALREREQEAEERQRRTEIENTLGKTAAVAEDLNAGIVIESKATTTGWTMNPEGAKRCSSRLTRPRMDFTCGRRRW